MSSSPETSNFSAILKLELFAFHILDIVQELTQSKGEPKGIQHGTFFQKYTIIHSENNYESIREISLTFCRYEICGSTMSHIRPWLEKNLGGDVNWKVPGQNRADCKVLLISNTLIFDL